VIIVCLMYLASSWDIVKIKAVLHRK